MFIDCDLLTFDDDEAIGLLIFLNCLDFLAR
jgi:hypothetical protein